MINRTEEIPFDYDGIKGVPITFMDKYNLLIQVLHVLNFLNFFNFPYLRKLSFLIIVEF
ncbi:MAG: adenine-specific methyltransferase EcoRI family protein [Prevotella sp.]